MLFHKDTTSNEIPEFRCAPSGMTLIGRDLDNLTLLRYLRPYSVFLSKRNGLVYKNYS